MNHFKASLKILLLILFIFLFNEITIGQTLEDLESRPEPSMVGLSKDSIYVSVSGNNLMFLFYDFNKFCLLIEQFTATIISQLRKAGIKVSNDELVGKLKYPNYYISIDLFAIGNNQITYGYAYSVKVGLWQKIILFRDRNIKDYGTTWTRTELGYVSKEELFTQLYKVLNEKTKEFIIEYLKANSK